MFLLGDDAYPTEPELASHGKFHAIVYDEDTDKVVAHVFSDFADEATRLACLFAAAPDMLDWLNYMGQSIKDGGTVSCPICGGHSGRHSRYCALGALVQSIRDGTYARRLDRRGMRAPAQRPAA